MGVFPLFTPLSHKRNMNKSRLQVQHHCKGHLKNEVMVVCFLTLEALVGAWATAAASCFCTHKNVNTHVQFKIRFRIRMIHAANRNQNCMTKGKRTCSTPCPEFLLQKNVYSLALLNVLSRSRAQVIPFRWGGGGLKLPQLRLCLWLVMLLCCHQNLYWQ